MPAAQDKIVYLYFICNCKLIVKNVAYVSLMFSCIVYLRYYYYYICYCAEIKKIVVHRCDHNECSGLYKTHLR